MLEELGYLTNGALTHETSEYSGDGFTPSSSARQPLPSRASPSANDPVHEPRDSLSAEEVECASSRRRVDDDPVVRAREGEPRPSLRPCTRAHRPGGGGKLEVAIVENASRMPRRSPRVESKPRRSPRRPASAHHSFRPPWRGPASVFRRWHRDSLSASRLAGSMVNRATRCPAEPRPGRAQHWWMSSDLPEPQQTTI